MRSNFISQTLSFLISKAKVLEPIILKVPPELTVLFSEIKINISQCDVSKAKKKSRVSPAPVLESQNFRLRRDITVRLALLYFDI